MAKSILSAEQKKLQPLLESIRRYTTQMNETIAVAESVTSGCIQLLLSTAQDAQRFFQGGLTVYNCAQKAIHLGVEPIFATSCNGVDPTIAIDMARNVCHLFRSQIGIAITGYATKTEDVKELFAHVAIVRNSAIIYEGTITPSTEGIDVQWEYAAQVIATLSAALDEIKS